jgi:hypothetical protein
MSYLSRASISKIWALAQIVSIIAVDAISVACRSLIRDKGAITVTAVATRCRLRVIAIPIRVELVTVFAVEK